MPYSTPKTTAAFQRAKQAMPLGVTSNFRYSGEATLVIQRGQGAYVWDMDDNQYIDYRLAYGPVILGHADPRVNQRVTEQLSRGTLYAHTHPLETEVAEKIIKLHPAVERVRYANSGTEATMHAVRLARAYTNREKLVKIEGAYHGNHDYALWSTANMANNSGGSPRSPIPVAQSSGMPAAARELIHILRFNDFEMAERLFRDRGHEIAALMVEPIMGNATCLGPEPGYLAHLRRLCDQYGVVLIFDEVKTGFRIAPGGAQQHFGVRADLCTYAKAMANGFPIGAIAGKRDVMMTIEPGAVGQGGTYCGNIMSVAACDATLRIMELEPVHATIAERGGRLMAGIDDILNRYGVPHMITGLPALFGVIIGVDGTQPQTRLDYRGVHKQSDDALSSAITAGLRLRGVLPDPDYAEPWFMCYAHSNHDVDETLSIYDDVVGALLA